MKEVIGTCLCGSVQVTIKGALSAAGYCHCLDCQRFGGSDYFRWITVFSNQIAVDRSALQGFVTSAKQVKRSCCVVCGTHVLWETSRYPDLVSISRSLFVEDVANGVPECHIWYKRRRIEAFDQDGLVKFDENGPDL